jgi:hypothetical protein
MTKDMFYMFLFILMVMVYSLGISWMVWHKIKAIYWMVWHMLKA